ncbi:MAG: DUF429 domain-containing protein [Rhodocyclaceae bacterium]|jgi:hypothetical protein|nr:DUF429 domain-containing protein [Rhodocyclaceae bacterium]
MQLFGVDFTSAPCPRKPITIAAGRLEREDPGRGQDRRLRLERFILCPGWGDFETFLQHPGPWLGGFDFPFGLPREAVHDLGWPEQWPALVRHCADLGKTAFREALDRHRTGRPAGQRYAHRDTDRPAGSHSPLKLVNPPVGLMFLAGAPRLLAAGLTLPGLHQPPGTPASARIAVEAYPGWLARTIRRESYKSDERKRQTAEREQARRRLVEAMLEGQHPLEMKLAADTEQCGAMIADAKGDRLDAVLALLQAAWSLQQGAPGYGIPDTCDPLEGWIAGVPAK